MQAYCNKDRSQLLTANWEIKTKTLIDSTINKTKHNNFFEQKQKFLDLRRKKLYELLFNEDKQYKIQLEESQETPEQVRKKMEEKLNELKVQKEKERLEQVKIKMDKKFYQSVDELRKNDSDANALACYMEQENQMLDKMRKKEQERREEEIYDKIREFDIRNKNEKLKEEVENKKKIIESNLEMLDWQKKNNDMKLQNQKALMDSERNRLKEIWNNELINENLKKQKQKFENKIIFEEIEKYNRQDLEAKKALLNLEKNKDREMIQKIIEREHALDEIDKHEKEKRKQEYNQNKKYLEYVLGKKKEEQDKLDKIAQRESDKEWLKTQEVWMKEEQARINLLRNVYREREEAVKYNKNFSEQERIKFLKERENIDKEVKKYCEEVQKIKEEEKIRRKKYQDDLKYQIEMKEKMAIQEKQDKIYEDRAAMLWEMEYQRKINEKKEMQLLRLNEIKQRGLYEN